MAFVNRFGSLFAQTVSQNTGKGSMASMLNATRYISSSKLFIRGRSYSTGEQYADAKVITIDKDTAKVITSSTVSKFIPTRSMWKGSFLDAFLFKMKKKKDLVNRKIWSCRSCITPEFVDCSVRIYNGKTFVRCKITEGKVGHKFGEFAFTRKRRPSRTNVGLAKKRGKSKV